MSIIAYTGLPGSGKSYSVVAHQILPALKQGRRVVTNIPLKRDAIRNKVTKGEIVELPLEVVAGEPEKLEEYATPGSVVIVDELWRLFPAGMKTDRVPEVFKSWLAEHRHRLDSRGRSMQIVFVTQDLAQIAAFARQLVEQTFHHKKLSDVGMDSRFRVDIYHGPVTGAVPSVQARIRQVQARYKSEVFLMYDSHTMSESTVSSIDESKVDARGNALKRPIIWLGIPGGLALVAWATWTMAGILSPDDGAVLGASVARAESGAGVPVGPESDLVGPVVRAEPRPELRPVSEPLPAKQYRVAGYMYGDEEGRAMIDVPGEGVVMIPWGSCWQPGDGLTYCRWDGHEVTEVSAERL